MTIEIKIIYSHRIPSGDEFYTVYANHRHIGHLTNMLSSGWRFEPFRKFNLPMHTFNSLTEAFGKLPDLVIGWLAQAYLNNEETR